MVHFWQSRVIYTSFKINPGRNKAALSNWYPSVSLKKTTMLYLPRPYAPEMELSKWMWPKAGIPDLVESDSESPESSVLRQKGIETDKKTKFCVKPRSHSEPKGKFKPSLEIQRTQGRNWVQFAFLWEDILGETHILTRIVIGWWSREPQSQIVSIRGPVLSCQE